VALKDDTALTPIVGTPKEVQEELGKSEAGQVVAFPFSGTSAEQATVLARTVRAIAPFIGMIEIELQRQENDRVETLVNAVVHQIPPSPNRLKEAAMLAQAKR